MDMRRQLVKDKVCLSKACFRQRSRSSCPHTPSPPPQLGSALPPGAANQYATIKAHEISLEQWTAFFDRELSLELPERGTVGRRTMFCFGDLLTAPPPLLLSQFRCLCAGSYRKVLS